MNIVQHKVFGETNYREVQMQQEQLKLPSGVVVRGSNEEQYVIEGLLGKGEMGAVYLVKDRHIAGKSLALKEVINPNKHDRERFLFEGDVLKRLNHRALPCVYRIFENDKLRRVYILMDYIKGRNLEDLRREQPEGYFSLSLVIPLMSPIVEALIYLHTQKPAIVHRDVKPANIIIPVGADEAMLVDFGSAKEYIPTEMFTVASRLSPGYAAPEQYGSGTGPRTDIYGLSATIYTLLTGIIPTDAISRSTRKMSNGVDPLKPAHVHNPAVPVPVSQALQRAMSISSTDRFETVQEFWQILTDHAEQQVQLTRIAATEVRRHLQDTEEIETISSQTQRQKTFPWRQTLLILALIVLLVLSILILNHLSHP